MTSPDVLDQWNALPPPARRAVRRAARRGQEHADPTVAHVAYDWAVVICSAADADRREFGWWRYLLLPFALLMDLFLGDGSEFLRPIDDARELRLARRIRAAHEETPGS